MNRVLTTVLAVALLLGLGALAVLALPGASAPLAAAPFVSAAAPDAPMATSSWNAIALPLDMSATLLKADNVKAYIESFCTSPCTGGVQAVAKWNTVSQGWTVRTSGLTPNFDVYPGQALLVKIGPGVPISYASFLGNVPPQCPSTGCIRYGVSPGLPTLASTGWSFVMIPLDKSSLKDKKADNLKLDIDPSGLITKVAKWNPVSQGWTVRTSGLTPNFDVIPGYPYLVYANGLTTTTWPNVWP